MTRKALIIVMPGIEGTKAYLPGTRLDLKNYDFFLKSPAGGKYQNYEFDYLVNPTINQIKEKIRDITENFSFVVFSGHGGINKYDGGFYLEAKDGSLHSNNFRTSSDKQLIIFDTCRSFYFEELNESSYSSKKNLLEGSPINLNFDNKVLMSKGGIIDSLGSTIHQVKVKEVINSKELYNQHLMRCENGIISVYSSQKGEASGEDPRNGGYYSSSLIATGLSWNNEYSNAVHILDIWEANKRADDLMKKIYLTSQNSEINGGRRYNWFPFAVK